MTAILKDKHGLYVKASGAVYRPESSKWDRVHSKRVHKSSYQAGEEVATKKVKATPFVAVIAGDTEEWWVTHGPFLDNGAAVPTEKLWQPVP